MSWWVVWVAASAVAGVLLLVQLSELLPGWDSALKWVIVGMGVVVGYATAALYGLYRDHGDERR